ncbi:MAG TPA: YjbE family putative metal transport protein [Syntrophales bacterium]|nr:YjbE family putative metal transport protein [Syntrophales bacterium]
MDLGIFGQVHFTWDFLIGFLSIIIVNLVLSGDNAFVIAMAVRSLPGKQRMNGIVFGVGVAVVLRIALTFLAALLLQIRYVKLIGGAIIIWIAINLLADGATEERLQKEARTLWHAFWIIIVSDIAMSIDNVLAVAAASKGNLFLIIFGLGFSIPIVVFASTLLVMLIDKYPIIIYLGAAVLGQVGGEMMVTDPFIVQILNPSNILAYCVEAFFTIGVVVAGKLRVRQKLARR